MSQGPFAHSLRDKPMAEWEPLEQHLQEVACGAAERAEWFGWAETARIAGLLHDVGKASTQFQAYIRKSTLHGGDHST